MDTVVLLNSSDSDPQSCVRVKLRASTWLYRCGQVSGQIGRRLNRIDRTHRSLSLTSRFTWRPCAVRSRRISPGEVVKQWSGKQPPAAVPRAVQVKMNRSCTALVDCDGQTSVDRIRPRVRGFGEKHRGSWDRKWNDAKTTASV